jgi:hypothetical protein
MFIHFYNCKMCWNIKPDQACGLPPGTIRALISIISIIMVYSICGFLIIMLVIDKQYQNAVTVAGVVSSPLGLIIGYYFGSKASQTSQTSQTPLKDVNPEYHQLIN